MDISGLFRPMRLMALTLLLGVGVTGIAQAADLTSISSSRMTGITFDDQPMQLPPQRHFQTAMLTAGSEIGRTCGNIEAYGWRMSQNEQTRVDRIFNNVVDRLRALGYAVEMKNSSAVSSDVTLFTADRTDRHFLFLWSAGDVGLVMTLCETEGPQPLKPAVQTFKVRDLLETPVAVTKKRVVSSFSPVGRWVGSYTCAQGNTGATLDITSVRGNDFDGEFYFYPTAKNPSVPEGRYRVKGQYDPESQRVLINPGVWLQRPANYYNTIIVGGFNPSEKTLSAYFQGVTGCTSFEAQYKGDVKGTGKPAFKKTKPKAKPKTVKKAAAKPGLSPGTVPAEASLNAASQTAPAQPEVAAPPVPPASPSATATLPKATAETPVPTPAAEPKKPEAPALMVGAPTPVTPAK